MADHTTTHPGAIALRRWARHARNAVMQVTVLGVVAVLATIALTWSVATGVSSAIAGSVPWHWLAIGLVAVGVRAAANLMSERAGARAGLAIMGAAREDIRHAVAKQGAGILLGASAGARVAQIVDRTARLAGWASRWMPGSRLALIAPVLILIAVATQSWVSALVLAASVVVLPLFLWLTVAGTRAAAAAQQDSLDELSGAFQLRTEHAGLIRAFRAIGRETESLRDASLRLKHGTMHILRVAFLSTAVLEFFTAVSIALLAVYIGFKLLGLFPFETGETVTLQEGMMVLVLAPEFFAPIRRMSTLHHDRADAISAADMLEAWLSAETPERKRQSALVHAPHITFENVMLSRDGVTIARKIDFVASPGSLTALWGPSGSGKTSCLLHLLGLVERNEGFVRIDGDILADGASLADSVAYIRQAPWLFEGTLDENLRVGNPHATEDELLGALAAVGADHLANAAMGGLKRPIARGGQGLSGGERQRVALARALLRKAPVWLLDEPTAHLDADGEESILQLIRGLAQGRTIIIATHSAPVRKACDLVVALPLQRGATA